MKIIEEERFENKDFSGERLAIAEYDSCVFEGCNFANADLSRIKFLDCQFNNCTISNTNISDTQFKSVVFINSKLIGIVFEHANDFLFEVHFEHCKLNLASFFQVNLKRSSFEHCKLHEVDFTEANLAHINFKHCDLFNAIFVQSNIEKVDFRTALNYSIDLNKNKHKKALFSKQEIIGLVHHFDVFIE